MHIYIYISLVLIVLIQLFLNFSDAFQISPNQSKFCKLFARRQRAEVVETVFEPTYEVGKNLPEEIINLIPIYDMILVERFNAPERTSAGILLPKIEGKDKKHTAKVVAIGKNYGLESEQGRLQSLDEIAPCKVGDIVYIRVSTILWRFTIRSIFI